MASITLRNIPNNTKEILPVQAVKSGVSLEEHARQILDKASTNDFYGQQEFLELAGKYFSSKNGVELELPPRNTARKDVEFKK